MRGQRSVVVGLGVVAGLIAASGCGSSAARTHTTGPAKLHSEVPAPAKQPSLVRGVSPQSVDRALLALRDPQRPKAVSCRASTMAERSAAPFAPTSLPLFTCELTIAGERASYVVQVLHNGCFVAERRRPGRAVYGCGADGS